MNRVSINHQVRRRASLILFFPLAMALSIVPFIAQPQQIRWTESPIQVESTFRALSVVDDSIAWIAGSKGIIGMTRNGGLTWEFMQIKGAETMDFRSIYAFGRLEVLVANTGSPARIYRTSNGGQKWAMVMEDSHPQAFIDAIDFRDDHKGFALGDPRNGKATLLRTMDGGIKWQRISTNPTTEAGEAFFAASGTAMRYLPDGALILGTGGNSARVMVSVNDGENWISGRIPEAVNTESGGVFSIFFSDAKNGIAVGGDYKQESKIGANAWFTANGGKSWKIPTRTTSGYRSCVEQIGRNLWLAVGPNGGDFSTDGGRSWDRLPGISAHVVRKARLGKLVLMAGNSRIWRLE